LKIFLLFSVFVVSVCGLVYELIAATVASYLLGDSITHFSTIIGTYLFAMGVGSYLAQFVKKRILETFIRVELLVAIIGGFSAAILYSLFPYATSLYFPLYSIVFVLGTGVGLEIPLLMRILKSEMEFSKLVSTVLSFDYVGALFASILFPIVFIPNFGIINTSFFFGLANALVGVSILIICRKSIGNFYGEFAFGVLVIVALSVGLFNSESLMKNFESNVYNEPIIYSSSSPYQRVVLSRRGDDIKLYLNGQLQFNSRDEYRYHEALVHPGLASIKSRENVLILGGGDGLALREVLKYQDVKKVYLIDLDPKVVSLFKGNEQLSYLNSKSLSSEKLEIIHDDAFKWIRETNLKFDFVIIDLPDPTSFSLGKLYTNYFYSFVKSKMTEDGAMVVQATSPLIARKSFWQINKTLESIGLITKPYHIYVPSFTEWGFILASKNKIPDQVYLPVDLKFMTEEELKGLFHFSRDMNRIETDIQTLSSQTLVSQYAQEWSVM
jgi:spermidine synthase